jgi:TonB family protein|nr:TonB family protein [Kofleriaceae bacterium]
MNRIAASLVAALLSISSVGAVVAAPRPLDTPSLPSADRIAPWIRDKVGNHVTADVRLCIAPDGHVARVEMVRGSTYAPFDRAVMKDISAWQFKATGDSRCTKTTIDYDASSK